MKTPETLVRERLKIPIKHSVYLFKGNISHNGQNIAIDMEDILWLMEHYALEAVYKITTSKSK